MHPVQISGLREPLSWLPSPDYGPGADSWSSTFPRMLRSPPSMKRESAIKENLGALCSKYSKFELASLELAFWRSSLWTKKKKSFQLGERKGSRRSSALPAGKSLPIYSSLRQGWIRVWTSVSTAVRFPKKTADKNVIWILDRFGKVSALFKKKKILWEP